MHVYTYIYIRIHKRMQYLRIHITIHIHIHTCVCIYKMYVYTCVHTYMYVYVSTGGAETCAGACAALETTRDSALASNCLVILLTKPAEPLRHLPKKVNSSVEAGAAIAQDPPGEAFAAPGCRSGWGGGTDAVSNCLVFAATGVATLLDMPEC